jgi:hypothetical protein
MAGVVEGVQRPPVERRVVLPQTRFAEATVDAGQNVLRRREFHSLLRICPPSVETLDCTVR